MQAILLYWRDKEPRKHPEDYTPIEEQIDGAWTTVGWIRTETIEVQRLDDAQDLKTPRKKEVFLDAVPFEEPASSTNQPEEAEAPKKYGVFNNGKPASSEGFSILTAPRWKTHKFSTFEAAQAYAQEWIGPHYRPGMLLVTDKEYHYAGLGDTMCIRTLTD